MQLYAILLSLLGAAQDRVEARGDRGATAVEYGLMVALIAAVIIGAVTFLGEEIDSLFSSIGSKI